MTSKDFALIRFELATSKMPQKICLLKKSHQAKKRYGCWLWNLADLLNHSINQSLLKIFKKHKQFQLTLDFNFVSYLYLCYAASFALRMSKLRGFHLNEQLTLTTLGVVGSNFSRQQRQHRRLIGAEQEQRNSWRAWEMIFDLTKESAAAATGSERIEADKETGEICSGKNWLLAKKENHPSTSRSTFPHSTFKSLLILLRALCLQIVFSLVLALPCPFSVDQFTRPLNLTLIVFSEKLGLAHSGLPVGIARRGCCIHPPLREPFAQLSDQQESSLQRTLFPTPPSGQVPSYCRINLARYFFAIGGSFSLDHQLFCKALPGTYYLHGRSVCQWDRKDLCSLKESLLPDMWHHALGSMLVTASTFKKFLSDGTCFTSCS